ncbi:MAG: DUF2085 domain-containing protein [Acidobacteria bacterium]|nr:DUF2085 domain-containing protein [Acidobacteriota bacterium]
MIKILFFFSLFLLVFIIVPLIIQNHFLLNLFNVLFSPFCHQEESLSLSINGSCMSVCSRCFGVYTGFFIAIATIFFSGGTGIKYLIKLGEKKLLYIFLLAWLLIAIDIILFRNGFVIQFHVRRFISGFIVASVFCFLMLKILYSYFRQREDWKRP